jgi:hypothetical protein
VPLTPYPSIPLNFGLAKLVFTLDGAIHDPMVLHGYQLGDLAGNADDHAESIWTAWSSIMGDFSTSLALQEVDVVENRSTGLVEGHSSSAPIAGSTGGQPVPPNTSLLVHKTTGLIGKHFRGRIYWPGLPASACDTAQTNVRATPLAAFQVDFDSVRTLLVGDNLTMFILHRSTAVPPTEVIDLHVEPLLATQSKRLRKVAHR